MSQQIHDKLLDMLYDLRRTLRFARANFENRSQHLIALGIGVSIAIIESFISELQEKEKNQTDAP